MAGCVNKPTKLDPCAGWSPIYVSRADVLSNGTAQAILSHNQYGERLGCWKPGH